MTADDLAIWEEQLNAAVRSRNTRELAFGAVSLLALIPGAAFDVLGLGTGVALLAVGVAVILAVIGTRARPRPVSDGLDRARLLEHHVDHLLSEGRLLRAVPLWYVGPLVPGAAWIGVAASRGTLLDLGVLGAVLAVTGVVVALNWRVGSHYLDRARELTVQAN